MPKRWHVRVKTNGVMDGVVIADTETEAKEKLKEHGLRSLIMPVYLTETVVGLISINEYKSSIPSPP